jgi:hypothetical protein
MKRYIRSAVIRWTEQIEMKANVGSTTIDILPSEQQFIFS